MKSRRKIWSMPIAALAVALMTCLGRCSGDRLSFKLLQSDTTCENNARLTTGRYHIGDQSV